ncbi:MAG: oxidoreductase [Acidimicrobiales bacterium mtb01]|nr:acryloyl-CoA reductase [Actinomycetota bacterium]TEX45347.1 MAG: oxidoreductase [Acidimicrobiales bacterium mtb01]
MSAETFPAFVFSNDGENSTRGVRMIGLSDITPEGVLVEVEWSSVNYKDALASTAAGKVARISPLIPGIDMAGRVVDPAGSSFAVGDRVIAHGYDFGTAEHGAYARFCRVSAESLIPLPSGMTTRDAMVIGTGGFTAAMSIIALERHGLRPGNGPVLVTGATGGVGSMAVSMLAGLGYEVVASSGKASAADYLASLGAAAVIDRNELAADDPRPLQTMTYAGAVDCVGGTTLANIFKRLKYGGAVAASGLTGGASFTSTVMPFILRGVSLLGVDTVQTPMPERIACWARLATDLKPAGLAAIGQEIDLNALDEVLTTILKGGVTGRYVVKPTA